jgi:hypothetical protein
MRNGRALFTILGKLSECARPRAVFEMAPGYKRYHNASQFPWRFPRRRAGSTKFFLNLCPAANRFERAVFRWPVSH